jgi:RNA polymerase sigma factor (sigma-70 family)
VVRSLTDRVPATFWPRAASNACVARLAEIRVDERLVAGARCGDERAQSMLYEALAPATFGLIHRIVRVRAIAEDLFQDTMITFYERLDGFRGEGPLGAWLRQIGVSKCVMHLRSPWHRARLSLDGGGDEPLEIPLPITVPSPPECIDLERALESLSPTARAVIWLYEVEGYSHDEIARQFGRTVSFSKSQLARAHRRLRAWFEPRGERQPCTTT